MKKELAEGYLSENEHAGQVESRNCGDVEGGLVSAVDAQLQHKALSLLPMRQVPLLVSTATLSAIAGGWYFDDLGKQMQ